MIALVGSEKKKLLQFLEQLYSYILAGVSYNILI